MVSKLRLGKLTKAYINIRAQRQELAATFKTQDDGLKGQQDKIKMSLLQFCKDNDIDSVRTDAGVFYRTQKKRYWTSDWGSMHSFVVSHGVPEFLEKRLNQTAVKEFLAENPDILPPGLNVESEYTSSIRRK